MKVNALGEYVPNAHSVERIKAAALLFAQRPESTYILLLDGPPESSDPLEGYGVVRRLQEAFQEVTASDQFIPKDRIVRGLTGINTARNMEEAYYLAQNLNLEAFFMVTQAYHMDRSVLFACNRPGFHVSPRLVEEVLDIKPRDYPALTRFKEVMEVGLAYFDPYGNIPTFLKEKQIKRNQTTPEEILQENIVYRRNGRK